MRMRNLPSRLLLIATTRAGAAARSKTGGNGGVAMAVTAGVAMAASKSWRANPRLVKVSRVLSRKTRRGRN